MRKFILGLLLVFAACRSLPQETADSIAISNQESAAVISMWNDKILPEENKADSTTDVNALSVEFADHVHKLFVARDKVQTYLNNKGGDADVAFGFQVATALLMDIDTNINLVFSQWNQWLDPAADKTAFKTDVQKMIADFQMLNRKFNDWSNQFGAK
ncbi:MAG: hypothetical protein MN733_06450 [Nitrososphaera sp.]|nr:hypothetical protein [Nitrososphaera sp.]